MEQGRSDHAEEIQEIVGGIRCPKSFVCYESGLETLCKAEDVGLESFLICLDLDPRKCKFSRSWRMGYLCECPLRIYLAKKLKV
jgi:hypothetical protein